MCSVLRGTGQLCLAGVGHEGWQSDVGAVSGLFLSHWTGPPGPHWATRPEEGEAYAQAA